MTNIPEGDITQYLEDCLCKCRHLICRSRRHPIADLPCGNEARYTLDDVPLCGVHLRYRLRAKKKAGIT